MRLHLKGRRKQKELCQKKRLNQEPVSYTHLKLMCGFSYMGTNTCPHYLNGECDGYVDHETELPKLILDENLNMISGCTFEFLLKSHNIDVKDIYTGRMKLVTYDEMTNAAHKHFML